MGKFSPYEGINTCTKTGIEEIEPPQAIVQKNLIEIFVLHVQNLFPIMINNSVKAPVPVLIQSFADKLLKMSLK